MVEDRKIELTNEDNAEQVSREAAVDVGPPREPQEDASAHGEASPGISRQQPDNQSQEALGEGVEGDAPTTSEARLSEVGEKGANEERSSDDQTPVQDEDALADEDDDEAPPAEPLELIEETEEEDESEEKQWYILKVQVNREKSICDALTRRVKVAGLDDYFGEILIPTEDVREFTKTGKQRIIKRKLYPGYILVNMAINDDTWFLVRETPGIGDFTGAAGKPTPMEPFEVERILKTMRPDEEEASPEKTNIRFKHGDRVRVKEGYFQNFEGEVESIDEANGRITVMINIFGRPTPVELDHWQFEDV